LLLINISFYNYTYYCDNYLTKRTIFSLGYWARISLRLWFYLCTRWCRRDDWRSQRSYFGILN